MDLVPIGDKKPRVAEDAYVDPRATLIGEVVVEKGAGIWPGAIIRADEASVVVKRGTMVLENTVIEAAKGQSVTMGPEAIISHGAIVHGAQVGRNSTVGIGAIVLDKAVVEDSVIVGAAALVPAGKNIPERSLVLGVPGKIVRELTDADLSESREEWKLLNSKVKKFTGENSGG